MKKRTEKERIKEKIKVIPHGAYEAGMTDRQADGDREKKLNDLTTDLQGNGYPVNRSGEERGRGEKSGRARFFCVELYRY